MWNDAGAFFPELHFFFMGVPGFWLALAVEPALDAWEALAADPAVEWLLTLEPPWEGPALDELATELAFDWLLALKLDPTAEEPGYAATEEPALDCPATEEPACDCPANEELGALILEVGPLILELWPLILESTWLCFDVLPTDEPYALLPVLEPAAMEEAGTADEPAAEPNAEL